MPRILETRKLPREAGGLLYGNSASHENLDETTKGLWTEDHSSAAFMI